MRVGFVVAMEDEYTPFLSSLGRFVKDETVCGMAFSIYKSSDMSEVVLARCGIGCVASSAATALLIGRFNCDFIVNFGLVGSLKEFTPGTLVIVKDVFHYDADLTPFGAPLATPADFQSPYFSSDEGYFARLVADGHPFGRLASGDKFIANKKTKDWLVSDFDADICDMEGAGIAITCARAHVPFIMLKMVSDGAEEGAAQTFEESKGKSFDFAVSVVLSVLADA
ncbi:MAG TPA: hypothetical protein DIC18_00625 [Clostridiales bacterium]|nr:hypothetical protein [Clostridiales bacterium]